MSKTTTEINHPTESTLIQDRKRVLPFHAVLYSCERLPPCRIRWKPLFA